MHLVFINIEQQSHNVKYIHSIKKTQLLKQLLSLSQSLELALKSLNTFKLLQLINTNKLN